MSTLKVDTYLTRGGASEIAIDKLKGVTAAGSMLVVGEGGTNTTNLQQGLCKTWINFNGTGTIAISDSYNITSINDDGTGTYTLGIANDMGNATYALSIVGDNSGARANTYGFAVGPYAAGSFQIRMHDDQSSVIDTAITGCTVHGDLA